MDMTDEHSETTNGAGPDRRPEQDVTPAPAAGGARSPFDLNAQQKKLLVVVLVVHLILARFTLRDLRRRPAAAVRGPKRLWRVWAATNTSGSVAYWLVGRRRGVTVPLDPEA
ncbi:MAG TPA: hypothetical protein VH012_06320 [Acidimicrobiales bacterium]|jgi:hypothetical protein|nr:hypothetical protein [Acidimicrobiales bacterium]